ncbi:MAG: alkaline phosphatase [Deltaproteobacteria bacterium]|nr:alkaline phosphatase [Deltaproteobacteria bacterium]
MKKAPSLVIALVAILTLIMNLGCEKPPPLKDVKVIVPQTETETKPTTEAPQKVKNVIFMIGDGMGVGQVSQAVLYRQIRNPNGAKLNLEKLLAGHSGLMTTYSYTDVVVDSASAATSMACGIKTISEVIGMDPQGYPCETVLEKATKLGKATGLVSNTRLSHATPGAFASHRISRSEEANIADDHIEKHNVDLFLDGGLSFLIPQYKDPATKTPMKLSDIPECAGVDSSIDGKSKREDQKNLIDVAKQKGYQFVCTRQQLDALTLDANSKVLGVFTNSTFPMIQERRQLASVPSVAHMTEKALELLSKKPEGFFLMVEGGLIDYAGHDNDPGTLLQETLDFDEALGVAIKFVETHPDTLLLVTADHETGGFGFSYAKKDKVETSLPSGLIHPEKYDFANHAKFDLLMKQNKSFRALVESPVKKLYPKDPKVDKPITMIEAAKMLAEDITKNTAYVLSDAELQKALTRKPGAKDFETCDFAEFYPYESVHSDALGRAVAKQSNAVWATGTHTASPVLVFAMGPEKYASVVRGMIDNTDIAHIINAAFNGVDYQPKKLVLKGQGVPESSPTETKPSVPLQ